MENLILSVEIILPLFFLMGTGYLIRRLKLVDDATVRKMNALVFKVFLPLLLFKNVLTSETDGFSGGVFIFAAIGITALFGALFLLIPRIEKDPRRRGVLIQGIARSNYALFGIPLVESIFPGQDVAVASLLVAIVIPLFNVYSVVALEAFRGGKPDMKKILLSIVKNPLIIGTLLGLILLLCRVTLPAFLMTPINDLSKIASPLALFLLGASFEFSRVSHNLRPLAIGVLGRLIVSPLIMVTLAALLGFRGPELASLMVVFGAPTAVSSFTMAQQMDADGELAGQQVVFSSALSILSVFLLVFLCKTLTLF